MTTIARLAVVAAAGAVVLLAWAWRAGERCDRDRDRYLERLLGDWTWAE